MPGAKAPEDERREQLLAAAVRVAVRDGLDRMTVRAVAAEAGVSHGLLHFHFGTKEQLLGALLDRVLERTSAFELGPDLLGIEDPLDRLIALLRQEMRRLTNDRESIRLFFDFWSLGTRNRAVRRRMGAELKRYREAFRPMADEVLRTDSDRFADVSSESLAAVVVAFIKGSAVQAMIDPRGFDVARFTSAADALLGAFGLGSAGGLD